MLLWSLLVIFDAVTEQADSLTLVAPSSVFEGDSIVLKCQGEQNWKIQKMAYHKDNKELSVFKKFSDFLIQSAVLSDSGNYFCSTKGQLFLWDKTSNIVKIKVQELFQRPVLTASSFQPIEGGPVSLKCETRLSPQRLDVQLQFCFFRENQVLGSGWSSSPELQISAVWSEDTGSYWCKAETVTHRIRKQSLQSQIHVQRIPISNVSLEIRAPGGQVTEGQKLILLCSVAGGTGNVTFSWYREATGTSMGKKTQRSLSAELEIPAVKESDAGKYYCRADNGHVPIQSKVVNIPVRKHSGNYSCEANNGLGAQCSEAVPVSISGPDGYRRDLMTAGVLWGLFGVLGFTGVALLLYALFHKISGESSATNEPRGASRPNPQEFTYSSPTPDMEELQPVYVNVGSVDVDVVYSQVWSMQQPESSGLPSHLLFCEEIITLGGIRREDQQQGWGIIKTCYKTL
ncbi:Fc receptor-like protein 2 isoform X5 [Homo sapiens]|uniref:Fc receptor-like protein 2 isoform X5 n=1 Tax=Homo sapiens TaxID=9606 RepID=UPI0007DC6C21|nr:Fc receptor-like protein 2 isoform X5 [Homo sapiens]XP_054194673.1 Fc receptor-like protein 2 isoform X5 [Homo sapiens]|eukprot:XP_016857806.1 Fc receptor-like protein 2 isoform X5 [Homo sapiens]